MRKLLCGLVLVLSGCATLKSKPARLKIVTVPAGAKIYNRGQLLGVTPAYIDLRPHVHDVLRLQLNGQHQDIALESHYRWHESFLANLIWLSPVAIAGGWITDFLTGYAWEYEPIGLVNLTGKKIKGQIKLPFRSIAIAPPHVGDEIESDEVVSEVQQSLQEKYPNVLIRPYEKTEETFIQYNYNYENYPRSSFRDALYHDLQVTDIAETRQTSDDLAETTITDVFSNQTIDRFKTKLNPTVTKRAHLFWRQVLAWSLGLIPNNFSVDIGATSNLQVEADDDSGDTYVASSAVDHSLAKYISLIGLRNVPPVRSLRDFHGRIRFVPEISYLNDNVQFAGNQGASDPALQTSYNWQVIYAGIGPELGLETPAGYLYLDYVPLLAESWINFNQPNRDWNAHVATVESDIEIGFLFYATDEVNFRLFTSVTTIDSNQWSDAFRAAGSTSLKSSFGSKEITGISVGYYFPSARRSLRKSVED